MQALYVTDFILVVLFCICYAFQFVYLIVPFVKKIPAAKGGTDHKIAVIIPARDEENVISGILAALKEQSYPSHLIYPVVIADNCTDGTAEVATSLGARVYERSSKDKVGKGYALEYALLMLDRDFGEGFFDAYIVFDADNIPKDNFITEINKVFSSGYDVVTCYRNSKNFADSWLSAGAAVWFLRESKYLNGSRARIGACPQVSGTGFLFSRRIKDEIGGWPYHTLTEDYEFTCDSVIKGRRFGYCESAEFYDEQTATFRESWYQRLRWCKGGLQSFKLFKKDLLKGLFSKKFFACYDLIMSLAPAYILSIAACLINLVAVAAVVIGGGDWKAAVLAPLTLVVCAYTLAFVQGFFTVLTEWKRINASAFHKILYSFTFPIYLMTFIPIAFVALFCKNVTWKKISHGKSEKRK